MLKFDSEIYSKNVKKWQTTFESIFKKVWLLKV
jgi:hypothetical protein